MIRNAVLALFASPFVLSNSEPPAPVYTNVPQVRQVLCDYTSGTAFRVGTGAYVTAWHVASATGRKIDGEYIQITHKDEAHDIAVLRTTRYGEPLEIDCGGFIDRQYYAGVGMAHGIDAQRVIFVMASAELTKLVPWGLFTTLWGDRFIPG